MFMAEKLIITEEVKKQNNMAFKMRSGNKVSFKNMGSSPAKDMKTGSYEHSFESPAKQASTETKKFYVDNYEKNKDKPGFQEAMDKAFGGKTTMDGKTSITTKKSPVTQKLNKGGEGQDQDKIFNSKGEHVGDYVNDKPVMKPGFKRPVVKKDAPVKPKEGDMKKYSDLEKYDDDRPVVKKNKPVKPTDEDMYKYSDLEKYDDDRPVSPNKQKQQSSGIENVSAVQTSKLGKSLKGSKKSTKFLSKRANMLKTIKKVMKSGPEIPKPPSKSQKDVKKVYDALLKKGYLPTKKANISPAKQAKTKGLGPRTAFGGVKNPELTKTKKTKSKKVMIDGPKKQVTGVKNPGNWQPHPNTFKAKKSTVSKHGQLDDAEIEYQNDLKLLKKMAENKKKK